ncbi:MAG: TonB-dependent receptor plug domain-containing protein [Acidobacteriaceae bacterium]
MNQQIKSTIRGKRPFPLLGMLASMLVVLIPSLMHGQSVDYGALEQLFNEPVTTSVDGSPQRQSNVPATMEIITAEDIRRSGAKDIPGVLRHVGGIDTLEWGNDNTDVSVRGYDQAFSPRLLVLVNGRQVYDDDYGYTPWSTVPVELSAIRQIEVVMGPNSALFGFNAVGGVINIITYNPLYDKIDTATATGGTQALGGGSVVAAHQFGTRAALQLTAGGHLDNDFSTPIPASEYQIPRRQEYREAISIDGVFHLNAKTLLSIEATQSTSEHSVMFPNYELFLGRYSGQSVQGKLIAESRIGLLQASVYTNWLEATAAPAVFGLTYHSNDRVAVAQVDDAFRIGAHHTFRVAGEYRYNAEPTTPFAGGNVHYSNFAASGMWDWKLAPSVSLTNAFRVDHLLLGRTGSFPAGSPFVNSDWNRSFTALSFNSGLVWKPADMDSLRFLVSRGAQLPSLVESGVLLLTTPFGTLAGSPFVDPTIVTNYEAGWDHIVADPHLLLRVGAFHESNRDLASFEGGYISAVSGPYFVATNIGNSTANGLELGLKGTFLEHYRWGANYRLEKISDHFVPADQNGAAAVDYQHTTPRSLVKSNLGWANEKWEMDGYLQYQSADYGLLPTPTGATTLTPIEGFVSLDGRIAYNPKKWTTWSISGQNLGHASQIQTSGPAVERRVLGTLTFNF